VPSSADQNRTFLRVLGGVLVAVALVLAYVLFGADRKAAQSVSPDGRWRAIATRNPDPPGARYRVGLGPAAGEVDPRRSFIVWRSMSHEPIKLEWRDTLLVIARKRTKDADSVWVDSTLVEGIVVRSDLR
jgi:hypothetical protein